MLHIDYTTIDIYSSTVNYIIVKENDIIECAKKLRTAGCPAVLFIRRISPAHIQLKYDELLTECVDLLTPDGPEKLKADFKAAFSLPLSGEEAVHWSGPGES